MNIYPTRMLGQQGLRASAIGLGCMGMSGIPGMSNMYGPIDESEAIATIHHALDLGITFLDTAEVYGPWTNEELLGRALKGKRQHAVLATKFGFRIDADGMNRGVNSHPEHIRQVLDRSLQRLQTDYIDLWYQHRVDPAVPIEEVVGEMSRAVQAGKVRYLGLSEAGPDTIRRAHVVHPISALQSEYSLWERGIESQILPTIRELGIGLVPYSPLGRGFLTGTIATSAEALGETDYRSRDPRFASQNFEDNMKLVSAVKEVAQKHKATPGQVALAWLLSQGDQIVPIPGTKRRSYLNENAAVTNVVLDANDLQLLDMLAKQVAGPRYGEGAMRLIER